MHFCFSGGESRKHVLQFSRDSLIYAKSWNELFDQDSHKIIKFTLTNVKPPAQIILTSIKDFSYFAIKSLKVTTLFYQNLF